MSSPSGLWEGFRWEACQGGVCNAKAVPWDVETGDLFRTLGRQ